MDIYGNFIFLIFYFYLLQINKMAEKTDLFNIYKNLLIMLEVRGYDISDYYRIIDENQEYFNNYFENLLKEDTEDYIKDKLFSVDKKISISFRRILTNLFVHKKTKKECLVFFSESTTSKTISSDEIKLFSRLLNSLNGKKRITEGIIVSQVKSKSKELVELKNIDNFRSQIYLDIDLMYNPTHFIFNPIKGMDEKDYIYGLEILSENETEELLRKNKIRKSQLPKMVTGDPIARYYHFEPNTVIKIMVKSVIGGTLINEEIKYKVIRPGEIVPPNAKSKL